MRHNLGGSDGVSACSSASRRQAEGKAAGSNGDARVLSAPDTVCSANQGLITPMHLCMWMLSVTVELCMYEYIHTYIWWLDCQCLK